MDPNTPPSRPPPPPPPLTKKQQRPKITLQIPDATSPTIIRPPTSPTIYWGPPKYYGKTPVPITAGSRISDPHSNPYFGPFAHMYQNKASDFMFKQFEGFKDFTMNTAKSGLSVGEKTAFWFYNRLKILSKKWFTHLFLTLCLLLYSIAGAVMFMTLEGPYEERYDKQIGDVRREIANKIEKIARNDTIMKTNPDFLTLIQEDLIAYEDSYSEYLKHVNNNNSTHKTWTFWNSMFFAGTIYTTIGYGHISPKTTSGRVATILYAIIGIPLFLLVLTDFGKLLTRIIKFFWAYIRRFYYTRSCRKVRRTAPVQEVMKGLNIVVDVVRRPSQIFSDDDIVEDKLDEKIPPPIERKSSDVPPPLPPKPGSIRDIENETEPGTPAPSVFEVDDEFNLPITLAIFILILYIIFGAVIINIWESWDFFESFYFVFISMSTIGLGDLVPNHPMYMMSSILYLVFGLALTSMCINVVQVKLSDTFRQASVKLGATIGLTVAEEDGSLIPIAAPVEIVPVHKPKSEIVETIDKENKDNDANSR